MFYIDSRDLDIGNLNIYSAFILVVHRCNNDDQIPQCPLHCTVQHKQHVSLQRI